MWAAFSADKSSAFKALVARMMYNAGKRDVAPPRTPLTIEHGFVPGGAPQLSISSGLATPQIPFGRETMRPQNLSLVPREGEIPPRSFLFQDETGVAEAYNTLNPFTQPNQGVNPLLRNNGGMLNDPALPPTLPVPAPISNLPLPKIERALNSFEGSNEFVLPNQTPLTLPPEGLLQIQKQLGRGDIFTQVPPRSRSAQSLLDMPPEGGLAHVERGLLSMTDEPVTPRVGGKGSKELAPIDYLPTNAKITSFKADVARIRKDKILSEEKHARIDELLDKLGGISEKQRVTAMNEIRKIIESSKE